MDLENVNTRSPQPPATRPPQSAPVASPPLRRHSDGGPLPAPGASVSRPAAASAPAAPAPLQIPLVGMRRWPPERPAWAALPALSSFGPDQFLNAPEAMLQDLRARGSRVPCAVQLPSMHAMQCEVDRLQKELEALAKQHHSRNWLAQRETAVVGQWRLQGEFRTRIVRLLIEQAEGSAPRWAVEHLLLKRFEPGARPPEAEELRVLARAVARAEEMDLRLLPVGTPGDPRDQASQRARTLLWPLLGEARHLRTLGLPPALALRAAEVETLRALPELQILRCIQLKDADVAPDSAAAAEQTLWRRDRDGLQGLDAALQRLAKSVPKVAEELD